MNWEILSTFVPLAPLNTDLSSHSDQCIYHIRLHDHMSMVIGRVSSRIKQDFVGNCLERPCYLCAVHFSIGAMAVVALFLPAAAMGKLKPTVVASLPDTYDYTRQSHTRWKCFNRMSAVISD